LALWRVSVCVDHASEADVSGETRAMDAVSFNDFG